MKFFMTIALFVLLGQWVQAGTIVDFKDWSGDDRFIESIGQRGCVAETVVEDGSRVYKLQVVTFPNVNGVYTNPLVIASVNSLGDSPMFYEAQASTNVSSRYDMTLFQTTANFGMVASRYDETEDMVGRLRADSTFKVNFLDQNGTVDSVTFSLRGSSKTIKTVLSSCN